MGQRGWGGGIEAENEGVTILLAVRWLGKLADIKVGAARGEISASSIAFVVRGEAVAGQPTHQEWTTIHRQIYQVEAYEEARPDAIYACAGHAADGAMWKPSVPPQRSRNVPSVPRSTGRSTANAQWKDV